MSLHPAYEVLRQHGIRFVTNSPDGTFTSNCKCGGNNNFVCYDDESVGWHCHDCGDSKIVPLPRAKTGEAQTGGNGASVPFMLTAAHKVELRALGYGDEQIRHLTPQEGQDIIAQKRKASASAPTDGGNGALRDDAEYQRAVEEAKRPEGPKGPKEPPKKPPKEPPKEQGPKRPPTIAEAAHAYHERGWKPVPIDRQTKKARGGGGRSATTTRASLAAIRRTSAFNSVRSPTASPTLISTARRRSL
jgi:hypothetical protein